MNKQIIFSDLDGTFLNHKNYSYKNSLSAIKKIKDKKIPLIFCSSRVRTEIEPFYKKLKIKAPFISENGGAIFIPKKFFNFKFKFDYIEKNYDVIVFGKKYVELRKAFNEIKKETGFTIKGFGDFTIKELSKNAGISLSKAKLAKQREFTEPFIIKKGNLEKIKKKILKKGFKYTKGGRYHYIMGNNDKGKTVKTLLKLFKKQFGKINSTSVGDGLNDLPMLLTTTKGYQVKNYKGKYNFYNPKIIRVNYIGPEGFTQVIEQILKK